ncbi:BDH_1b_G0044070.mRNA.1.CDS.1 [Saccharomyces cerevisiae]|nr:BDH_1b_G0044070.mRNA.1.CDS.1 [Saccharomyces cerevisiae]CAI7295184.1 BDH_1b_G0044070.mRNA.1.CDS.1 [Saccharomyces cerevisiae]
MPYAHRCYSIYHSQTYPTLIFHSMAHLSLYQCQMHSHHYARHLPQRFIPCAIYP